MTSFNLRLIDTQFLCWLSCSLKSIWQRIVHLGYLVASTVYLVWQSLIWKFGFKMPIALGIRMDSWYGNSRGKVSHQGGSHENPTDSRSGFADLCHRSPLVHCCNVGRFWRDVALSNSCPGPTKIWVHSPAANGCSNKKSRAFVALFLTVSGNLGWAWHYLEKVSGENVLQLLCTRLCFSGPTSIGEMIHPQFFTKTRRCHQHHAECCGPPLHPWYRRPALQGICWGIMPSCWEQEPPLLSLDLKGLRSMVESVLFFGHLTLDSHFSRGKTSRFWRQSMPCSTWPRFTSFRAAAGARAVCDVLRRCQVPNWCWLQ